MSAEIHKLRLTPRLLNHGYLNGFGWTEKQCELERIDRRLGNTVEALKRRQRVVRRAIRMEINRHVRERDAEGGAA
jgi:hypothetical protein